MFLKKSKNLNYYTLIIRRFCYEEMQDWCGCVQTLIEDDIVIRKFKKKSG